MRCTSDAPSPFTCFVNGLHHVRRAVLDEAFPPPERRTFGCDRDAPAVDFPSELVAGTDVERVADFLRHGRLPLASDGGDRHRDAPYEILSPVRTAEWREIA